LPSQILAVSGVLGDGPRSRGLITYAASLAGSPGGRDGRTRLCFVPTAEGDSPLVLDWFTDAFGNDPGIEPSVLTFFPQPGVPDVRRHLLAQDVLWVGGGSVVNLMAVWRAHGLPEILHECWQAGVVMAGQSAGSLCWHVGGPTDSFGDQLEPFDGGLGWLPWSNGVHDDLADQPRRSTFRRLVARGVLPPGYATEGGVGLHYVDGTFHEAVTVSPGRHAWWVEGDTERPITPRELP
jgi:peptidase E